MQRLVDHATLSRPKWLSLDDPTQLTNRFEFWPSWTIFLPMALMMLILSVRARSLTFFRWANPGIENGGLFGYSKSAISDSFPRVNVPKSLLVAYRGNEVEISETLRGSGIDFPLFLKPNQGERGRGVCKVEDHAGLRRYFSEASHGDYLIQEEIPEGIEFGVFCIKDPKTPRVRISSLTIKVPLRVVGDGFSSIGQLAAIHPRVSRYRHEVKTANDRYIPGHGEVVRLSRIGNHCRGATFLDCSPWIDRNLEDVFSAICKNAEGFFYGRLDVIVPEWESLWEKDAIRIIEVNGSNSEPIHIYSPGFSYWSALGVIWNHLDEMATIARKNYQTTDTAYNWRTFLKNHLNYRKTSRKNVG
ncbi:hypothetical protein [Mariniradius sediminis]|uniref:ATP-grasp domain-containing protein n=1 Tax=Mariniradius sediminis TaxID=2909237 RepID=A0ABS9BPN8_9BACT|nr:hypothetical protein [Mariniradius sediminis]MCF1749996.1 hypothetical protein [Mariniradius sediminis]